MDDKSSLSRAETAHSACPACGAAAGLRRRAASYGAVCECQSCGLFFADPMRIPASSAEFFTRAYDGEGPGEMRVFSTRLAMARYLAQLPGHSPWARWHRTLIATLLRSVGFEAVVLDIGCGTGLFMRLLQESGLRPVGLDVGRDAIRYVQSQGYPVWDGPVSEYPQAWPQPAACTLNLVLHHVPEPLTFLSEIHQRFPEALLLVSDLRTSRPAYPYWTPPRHLTIWTERALREIMGKAGYVVHGVYKFPTPLKPIGDLVGHRAFLALPRPLRRAFFLRLYYAVKPAFMLPVWALFRVLGINVVISVVGSPVSKLNTARGSTGLPRAD